MIFELFIWNWFICQSLAAVSVLALAADDEEPKCVCDNGNDVIIIFCWLQNNFIYRTSFE